MPKAAKTYKPRLPPGRSASADDQRPTAARRGYDQAWRNKRHKVLARDGFTCQAEGCGRIVMGKGEPHIDHIIAKAKGGSDDMDNLQTLCASCHSRKTVREDGGFGHGKGNTQGTRG